MSPQLSLPPNPNVEAVSSGRQGPVYPEGDLPEQVAAILKAVEGRRR